MSCEAIRIDLTESIVQGLEPRRRSELETHLLLCADCRTWAREETEVWEALGQLNEAAPTEAMRARFEGLLDSWQEPSRAAGPRFRLRRGPGWHPRSWGAVAAAACLLLGIGVGRWTAGAGAVPSAELAALQEEVGSLNELVALSLLRQESAASRLEGVRYGRQAGQPDGEVLRALSDRIVRDPSTNVRLAAVEALAPLADRPEVQLLLVGSLRQQEAPLVQIALIDLLIDSESPGVQKAIDSLLDNPLLHTEVRRHIAVRRGGEA